MDFLFAGLGEDPKKDPYESLSDLCTMLIVAEEGLVPLEPITDTVLTSLRKSPQNGDVHVMAARALALLLDKFTPSFSIFVKRKGPSSVTEGFKAIFSLVSDSAGKGPRSFSKTTKAELTEELLKCLTLGSSSTPAVRAVMPATEVQLRFCQSSLDGSKWTSCKVLRHCALLARCGQLLTTAQRHLVKQMLYDHLKALTALDIDYEWDELLRTVMEGIVTLRVWCDDDEVAPSVPKANVSTTPARHGKAVDQVRHGHLRKRPRAGEGVDARHGAAASPPHGAAAGGHQRVKKTEEHFIDVCIRICGNESIAETRKELVLACASTVLHARDVLAIAPTEARVKLLRLLLQLLQATSQTTFSLADPFARRDKTTSETGDEDGFKPLPNLQWEVPTLQWTALTLLCKLLGAEPATERAYVWGWRDEGDVWYWYRPNERRLLTAAFFARREEVLLKSGEHQVNLLSMTDCHRPTKMVARIHFQPVPYLHTLENSPLTEVYAARQLVAEYAACMPDVRQVLRAMSFGTTPPARLAKLVYLHAVSHSRPDNTEETVAAFRNLVADCPVAVMERFVRRLVERDRDWAPILCEAGVADAIAQAAHPAPLTVSAPGAPAAATASAAKKPRREVGGHTAARHRGASPERAPAIGKGTAPGRQQREGLQEQQQQQQQRRRAGGESPVVRLLRDAAAAQRSVHGSQAASATTTPQLTPLSLPLASGAGGGGGLLERFKAASFSETVALLQAMVGVGGTQLGAASEGWEEWLQADETGRRRVGAALVAVVLRELQATSIEGRRRELVDAVAEDVLLSVVLCGPPHTEGDDAAGAAAGLRCPNGHPLRIHFSTNWRCDTCGHHTGYGSSACRCCNFDLCHECVERTSNRLEVNPTATVGDVARVWLARHKPNDATASTTKQGGAVSTTATGSAQQHKQQEDNLFAVFTKDAVLSASAPSKLLARLQAANDELHCGQPFASCACGAVTCPSSLPCATHATPSRLAPAATIPSVFARLLAATAEVVAADVGVVHALVEATESHGGRIFLEGLASLPEVLRLVLRTLAPHLPLSLRTDMSKFFAIDCRRYALFHLQERGIFLRGAVQGEIGNNGLARKVGVVRGDVADMTARLYRAFAALPSLRNKVEFFFEGEEGTGNGPTQELYTELSRGYREEEGMWFRREDTGVVGFPSCKALYWQHFFVLGAACARAFVDGYAMDIDVLPCVWSLLLPSHSHSQQQTSVIGDDGLDGVQLAVLKELDPALTRSFEVLLQSSDDALEAMGLVDDDGDAPLTSASVGDYVRNRVREHLEMGLINVHAMHLGLLTALDPSALQLLSAEELSAVLLGGRSLARLRCRHDRNGGAAAKLFSEKELRAVTVAAHGYSADSKEVDMFASIVGGDFDAELQSYFLEFLTGSARLPLSGLAGLGRKITVVRKDMDDRTDKQQTLPSCNTCFLYLKLPPYTTRDIMKERLTVAIREGRKNFSLS